MAEFKPTHSQELAIDTSGRGILVSAGAGSGKTKVLTERLIKRISDEHSPADIDSFLVITFTKAAAEELRSRIIDEIGNRLAEQPDNRRLRRQNALCQKAQIGTIHSFCSALLRENCHALGLSPEFKVIEEDRSEEIKLRVIERVMDAKYESADEDFALLTDTVGRGRDDARLTKLVLTLHKKMQSHARPDKWALSQIELLEKEADDAALTPWGQEIMQMLRRSSEYWAEIMQELADCAAAVPKIQKAYGDSLAETALQLRDFRRGLNESWDKARSMLPIEFPKLGVLRQSPDPVLSEKIKQLRKECQKVTDTYPEHMLFSSEKMLKDMRDTAPAMRALLKLTLEFDAAFEKEKRRCAEVDFSDLEHYAARLLTDENGERTEIAKNLAAGYTEIMVDEFQDVSRVQETIFNAVSDEGRNLFMVGDVKQSIYRFRLADPGIFTEKYLSYPDADKAVADEAVRIMLQENFRSRREITDGANQVFSVCMSRALGDIDYDENACLKCGAEYPGTVPKPEMLILSLNPDEDEESPDKTEAEADMVAAKIKSLMESGTTVFDHGRQRPLRYGDIALLMRSANTVGAAYRRQLIKHEIPVASGQSGVFFKSIEVSNLICLLAVIDNPHQDVPLIAALRSPMFGFEADDLSNIRACDKKADFYTALQKCAGTDAKCADFIGTLNRFRQAAPDLPVSELLSFVYDELNLAAIYSAMADGKCRRENLEIMKDYARRFEKSGYRGLHRFVEWLNRLCERGEEPGRGVSSDAVRIMTVHKSKGLEFPVVFLCDTSRRFNRQDAQAPVLIHPELGLGPKKTETARGIEYPTMARNAIKLRMENEMLSEEMRLLYVALTRAKERLFVTAAMKKPEEKIEKMSAMAQDPMPPELLMKAQNLAAWMIYACLSPQNKFSLDIVCRDEKTEEAAESNGEQAESPVDDALKAEIAENLSFEYAHKGAQSLPSKVTATQMKGAFEPDEEAQSLTPNRKRSFRSVDFLRKDKPMTGTEKGTATHKVLQFIDYAKTDSTQSIEDEIERLRCDRHLSDREAQAVDAEAIYRLFSSEVGERIKNADKLYREFKFSLLCDAGEFFPDECGEKVLLQGVIDCCIESAGGLTIVDYKTDRVHGEALEQRAKGYSGQLRAYAIAAGKITGKPVKECLLYFLEAGKTVKVDF